MNKDAWDALAVIASSVSAAYLTVGASVTHDGETFSISFSCSPNPLPGKVGTSTGSGMTISYGSFANDSASDTLHLAKGFAQASYAVDGTVSQTGADTYQATSHAVLFLVAGKEVEGGMNGDGESGNIVDQQWQATYQVGPPDQRGNVSVTVASQTLVSDNSQSPSVWFDYSGMVQTAQAAALAAAAGLGPSIRAVLSTGSRPRPKVIGA